jgi:hypothetical protein
MLTEKGLKVLSAIYSTFRKQYFSLHPGHNENECERAFLYQVDYGTTGKPYPPPLVKDMIEEIR